MTVNAGEPTHISLGLEYYKTGWVWGLKDQSRICYKCLFAILGK